MAPRSSAVIMWAVAFTSAVASVPKDDAVSRAWRSVQQRAAARDGRDEPWGGEIGRSNAAHDDLSYRVRWDNMQEMGEDHQMLEVSARNAQRALLVASREYGEQAPSSGADVSQLAADATEEELERAEEIADKEAVPAPEYTEDEQKMIAASQVTPIGKVFNGSFEGVDAQSKSEEMTTEYMQAAQDLAIQKDLNRIAGNNASRAFALKGNAALKAREDKIYATMVNMTKKGLNATRETYIAKSTDFRVQHAVECQKLMANNPYPPGSMQYKAVAVSCKDENVRNLENQTALPVGIREKTYGAYEDRLAILGNASAGVNETTTLTQLDDATNFEDISDIYLEAMELTAA